MKNLKNLQNRRKNLKKVRNRKNPRNPNKVKKMLILLIPPWLYPLKSPLITKNISSSNQSKLERPDPLPPPSVTPKITTIVILKSISRNSY